MSAQPTTAQTTSTALLSRRLFRGWFLVAAAIIALVAMTPRTENWTGTAAVVLFVLVPAVLRLVTEPRQTR